MAGTTGNRRFDTGTVLLLVVLGMLFLWFLRGCGQFPVAVRHTGDSLLHNLFFWLPHWGGLFGLGFLIQLLLAVWVWVDANRRGMQGFLWGMLVFFTSIVGLVVYLIVCSGALAQLNEGHSTQTGPAASGAIHCAKCRSRLDAGFKVCPYCGAPRDRQCRSCNKPVQDGWKICPYCGVPLEEGSGP